MQWTPPSYHSKILEKWSGGDRGGCFFGRIGQGIFLGKMK